MISDMSEELVDTSRFRLLRKIAEGGMGSVYEAVLCGAEGFEKVVAIKTILESHSQNKQFVELFIGEAKLVADLVHQNICQVYQLGKAGNRYYIAMEYVAGTNLSDYLARHRSRGTLPPVELATFIVSRVCRGLEYAHTKRDRTGELLGVVHRDISPRNIMISLEGEVKLTDFGVAKARNLMKDQEGDLMVGKIPYMSPEQAQWMPTDARSDLFSLGVVMFELLSGQSLFGAQSMDEALKNVLEKPIPLPSQINPAVPPDLDRIALRALQRDPLQRYQTAGEMGYDLEYAIYHKGYGPTILTLQKHLRELFPALFEHRPSLDEGLPEVDGEAATIRALRKEDT